MIKLKNYVLLGLLGLMGTLAIGVTSAYEVTYHPEANVSYTLNSGFDTSGEFTAGLITITDGNETYTIMDRNLGAISTGVDSSDSYGYYFQWGNNYGFSSDPNASIATSNTQVDASEYGPGNYYSSSTWITQTEWDSSANNNLRGGVSGTYEAMQGPCPEGYHVPSSEEWLGLSTMLGYDGTSNSNASKQARDRLNTELYFPFAGYRNYSSAGVSRQGTDAYYWSSYSAGSAYYLLFDSAGLNPQLGYYRSNGFSVRCFKNSPYSTSLVTIWDENGENEIWSGKIWSGSVLSLSGINFDKPNSYMVFDKLYTDPELTQEFDLETPITENMDLYVGYITGDTRLDRNGNSFEREDITICDPDDSSACITIMDRNLGATSTGVNSSDSYGYYFQWGNNYGFPSDPNASIATSNTQVDASGYGPGNYYSSSTWITKNPWDSSNNNNLRGGVSGTYEAMQGPCPEGYHVPSNGEWLGLLTMLGYDETYNSDPSKSDAAIQAANSIRNELYFPFAGIRSYSSTNVYSQGERVFYWSSIALRTGRAYYLYSYSAGLFPQLESERYYGFSVRCFKDSPLVTIWDENGVNKIWSGKIGSGSVLSLSGINFDKPNSYMVFDKLYTDPELTQEFDLETPITENMDLYVGYITGDTRLDRNGNSFEREDITICDPDDSSACITIMDRNLGATSNDTTSSDSYGYLFQWGNNYGFNSNGNISTTSTKATRLGDYVNNGYYGNKFIISKTDPYDYWSDSVINNGNHYNLWGGRYEDISEYDNNGTWQVINPEERQGQCPEGYHVPSYGEWNKIINIIGNDASTMKNQLNIPYAGYRGSVDGAINELGGKARLWSSSPYSETSPLSSFVRLDNGILIGGIRRANAASVRCFKNSPYSTSDLLVSFWDESRNNEIWSGEVESGSVLSAHADSGILVALLSGHAATKPGYMLSGWYDSDADVWYDIDNSITTGLSFRAVWNKYYELTYHPEANVSYTLNSGFDTSGEFTAGLITITDGDETYTIMDRNLGATSTGVDSSDSYGYYFQWGNNYGFPTAGSVRKSSTQVNASGYGPGNYYSSLTWITKNPWDSSANDNLRGGVSGTNEAMQGPCPEGYHVPSSGEWLGLSTMLGDDGTSNSDASKQARDRLNTELYFPFAGYRDNLSAGVNNQGTNARYRSSTAYSADLAYSLYFGSAGLSPQNGNRRSNGFSVRCFKNSPYSTSDLLVSFWTGEDMSVDPACSGQLASGEVISLDLLTCVEGLSSTKEGYSLSGRRDAEADTRYNTGDAVTTGLNLVAKWTAENFSITYDLDGGALEAGSTNPGSYTIESDDITLVNPNKEGYTFAGWTGTDLDNATMSVTIAKGSTGDREYYATWIANPKPVSHGGGGSTLRKDNCPNGDYSDSYYDGTCGKNPNNMSSGTEGEESIDDNKDSSSQSSSEGQSNNELQTAYEFAYENKITTMDSIEKADMEGGLTRIAMAKMLSQYAINVLGKKPANTIVPKFSDITEELNAEYDYGVSLAYQLGIMGINMPENKFRPFDKVTRAEFGTALSRLIFGIADGEEVYYTTHLAKLKAEGIITNDDPTLQELRGYVMLMLMRSAK